LYIIAPAVPSQGALYNVADGVVTVTLNRPDELEASRRASLNFLRSAPTPSPADENPQ
jgi:hypothetical protein